ncbi:MAG: squalene/phytoene synthase family protein [Rhodospirillaceae bacterium]|nr:squalene/phytoene synthase family protein [Rhodospirillaceae bacterium]
MIVYDKMDGKEDGAVAYCLEQWRREDRDRYLTLLFAPRGHRPVLAAMYAFNLECARAVAAGGEQPLLGQMRLQWWRDALADGGAHPVLSVLSGRPHLFLRLQALLSARERDLTDPPFANLADLVSHAAATGGGLAAIAAEELAVELAVETTEAARAAGTAYALVGMLRAIPYQVPGRTFQGRLCLPEDSLAGHGLSADDVWTGGKRDAVAACVRQVAEAAELELVKLSGVRAAGSAISPLLHGSLARAYLRRLAKAGYDPFAPDLGLQPVYRPLLLLWRTLLGRP